MFGTFRNQSAQGALRRHIWATISGKRHKARGRGSDLELDAPNVAYQARLNGALVQGFVGVQGGHGSRVRPGRDIRESSALERAAGDVV